MQFFKSGRGGHKGGLFSSVRSLSMNCIPMKLFKMRSCSCRCGNVRALSGFTRHTGAISSSYLFHARVALIVIVLLDREIANLRVLKFFRWGYESSKLWTPHDSLINVGDNCSGKIFLEFEYAL